MLFHSEIYWPAQVQALAPKGIIPLMYSKHAIKASTNDRYGRFTLPEVLNISAATVIEAEIDNTIRKFVYRTKLDNTRDICLVILKTSAGWLVKTAWLNLTTDNHDTLNRGKYAQAH